jgi:uncharacterized protein YdaT
MKMPWSMKDAPTHTKKATTPKTQKAFAKVANKVLKESKDEGKAIKIANSVVAKIKGGKTAKKPGAKPKKIK